MFDFTAWILPSKEAVVLKHKGIAVRYPGFRIISLRDTRKAHLFLNQSQE